MKLNYFLKPLLAFMLTALFSCAETAKQETKPKSQGLGSVELQQNSHNNIQHQRLNVGIVRFETALKNDNDANIQASVSQQILSIESQYLPIRLRNTLARSNHWGTIRNLPTDDVSMDLLIKGEVIQSDGASLSLLITAHDSRGKLWLSKRYQAQFRGDDVASDRFISECSVESAADNTEPFQNLYNQIANDLLDSLQRLSEAELKNIVRIAKLRHAKDLLPQLFSSTFSKNSEGLYQVDRLLADNDPMLNRIDRMRARHHLFIDTVDDHYQYLYRDMNSVYRLWLGYSCERTLELKLRQLDQQDQQESASSGAFNALTNSYRRYKISKIFEQEWQQLASGFRQELEPFVVELDDRVYTLSGSVNDQYQQWRKVLADFYRLETQP